MALAYLYHRERPVYLTQWLEAVFDKIYAKRPVIRCWTWHAKPAVLTPRRP